MKTVHIFYIGSALAALIAMTQITSCNSNSDKEAKEAHDEKGNHEEHPELAELMFHNQRFMDKLYFAGKSQNWKLADFYHEELEENMESLVEGKVMEEEVNLSELSKSMFLPALEELEKSITSHDTTAFIKAYDFTVKSCNNCHMASKHEFVKIITPTEPSFKNQQYVP